MLERLFYGRIMHDKAEYREIIKCKMRSIEFYRGQFHRFDTMKLEQYNSTGRTIYLKS